MELNLQILKEDLADLDVKSRFTDDRLIRRLTFPTIYKKEKMPLGHKIYIAESFNLPESMQFDNVPSFICIGPRRITCFLPHVIYFIQQPISLPWIFLTGFRISFKLIISGKQRCKKLI